MKDPNSMEAQAPDSATTGRPRGGFRAHLQGVGLHDLVMLQNLVRASGVFVVLSGDRTGTLHFSRGQLVHAEVEELTGEAAALEILSWRDGEFINADRSAPQKHTLAVSLESLLLRLAKDVDAARAAEPAIAEPPLSTVTGVRRRMDSAPSFRTTQPGTGMLAPSPGGLAAAATPGTAGTTMLAPKAPLRASEARGGVTNVLSSPLGALLDGNGPEPDTLAAKVAYMVRLTELVGQAMGAGDARSIRVRHPSTELAVRRHADGHVSASFGPPDAVAEAAPASSPARHT